MSWKSNLDFKGLDFVLESILKLSPIDLYINQVLKSILIYFFRHADYSLNQCATFTSIQRGQKCNTSKLALCNSNPILMHFSLVLIINSPIVLGNSDHLIDLTRLSVRCRKSKLCINHILFNS